MFAIPRATLPITVCRPSTVSKEEFEPYEDYFKELLKPLNERIENGGEVPLKEVYDLIGYPRDYEKDFAADAVYETFGWNKNGFGPLYKIEKKVIIKKVHID